MIDKRLAKEAIRRMAYDGASIDKFQESVKTSPTFRGLCFVFEHSLIQAYSVSPCTTDSVAVCNSRSKVLELLRASVYAREIIRGFTHIPGIEWIDYDNRTRHTIRFGKIEELIELIEEMQNAGNI